MARFKVYNKFYLHGKPTGRKFLYGHVEAKTKKAAEAKVNRQNRDWKKRTKSKILPKVVEVKKITTKKKTPKKKTKKKATKKRSTKKKDPFALFF